MNSTWKEALLLIIRNHVGQEITLDMIYDEMINNPLVTSYHLEPWTTGGQPRYQCWIRRGLTDLVNVGLISRVSCGQYRLKY